MNPGLPVDGSRLDSESMKALPLLSTGILVSSMSLLQAADWLHWRGPSGNGQSPDARPPVRWTTSENVQWKVEIPGRGSGSPVIVGSKVFVVSAVPSGTDGNLAFKLFCHDRKTGKLIWERTATETKPHQGTHETNGYASASPCSDGERIYAHFGSRGLYCYTLEGELVWKRDDFGKMDTRSSFGEGSSPTLAGDKILVPWDHEGPSALHALDKLTGKTVWSTKRDEPSCWATPLVVKYQGGHQVIMNGENRARSYDLATGKELWSCSGQTARPVASAVTTGDLAIVGSGFRGSYMGAFHLDGHGPLEGSPKVAWEIRRDTPDIASPLLSGERIYFHKGKSGLLTCLDARTGKAHYVAERIPGINSTYASPIAAGGHVYLTGRSGTTVVLKDSDKLEIVATNSVGETVDATPAPVDGQLFIRGERHLFCIGD